MSLITQCPACSTMFKVVPDQLRISDGWVRCGQCDEVFDANAHLQPAFDAEPIAVPTESPDGLDWGSMLETEDQSPKPAISLQFPTAAPTEAAASVVTTVSDPIPSAFAYDSNGTDPDAVKTDDIIAVEPELPADVAHEPVEVPATAPVVEEVDTPQFLKPDTARATTSGRLERVVLSSLSVMLVCMLAVQVVVQERDRITATVPSMATGLQPVCEVLGCRISPLQQIESIVIDHSSFSKAQSGSYMLGFAVKSTALTEVATPSLELTLTDMQERAVVRRVFSPRELGYQSQTLSPGGEWTAAVPVDLKLAGGSERVSGYRLLAFYP